MEERRVVGCLPYPPDPHDEEYGLEKLLGSGRTFSAPQSVDLIPYCFGVLDQSITESCVGQSVAQAICMCLRIQGVAQAPLPSREYIYFNARATHSGQRTDSGTYIRAAFKGMKALGFCYEEHWPFDPGKVNTQPSWNAGRMAADQRWLDGYYSILETGDDRIAKVKLALANKHPVVFGMSIDREFTRHSTGEVIHVPQGEIIGGHAMCIVGYDEEGVTIINSWGAGWGKKGFAKLGWDVMAWSQARDFMVPTIVPVPA